MTATQLAKALAVTTPGIKLWIDRLEERGLAKRQRSVEDRRAQHLRPTQRGTELVASVLKSLLQADRDLLAHLSQGEQRILVELLSKVAQARRPG